MAARYKEIDAKKDVKFFIKERYNAVASTLSPKLVEHNLHTLTTYVNYCKCIEENLLITHLCVRFMKTHNIRLTGTETHMSKLEQIINTL